MFSVFFCSFSLFFRVSCARPILKPMRGISIPFPFDKGGGIFHTQRTYVGIPLVMQLARASLENWQNSDIGIEFDARHFIIVCGFSSQNLFVACMGLTHSLRKKKNNFLNIFRIFFFLFFNSMSNSLPIVFNIFMLIFDFACNIGRYTGKSEWLDYLLL